MAHSPVPVTARWPGVAAATLVLVLTLGTLGAVAWRWTGTPDDPFYSEYSSHLQPLEGGNILVTESNAGRLFEVTRDGEVVWEYWNPVRTSDQGAEYISSVADGKRYAADELPFLAEGGAR